MPGMVSPEPPKPLVEPLPGDRVPIREVQMAQEGLGHRGGIAVVGPRVVPWQRARAVLLPPGPRMGQAVLLVAQILWPMNASTTPDKIVLRSKKKLDRLLGVGETLYSRATIKFVTWRVAGRLSRYPFPLSSRIARRSRIALRVASDGASKTSSSTSWMTAQSFSVSRFPPWPRRGTSG